MTEGDAKGRKAAEAGAEIGGGAILGALGTNVADPAVGAILGAVGAALPRLVPVMRDYASRALSSREKIRVDCVAGVALHEIRRRLDTGELPRGDGFFDLGERDRSAAEELLDGVMRKARDEHEEAKITYMGWFLASILFSESVSRWEANRLLRLLERLSYRQLCILGALARKPDNLRTAPLQKRPGSSELDSLLQECFELETPLGLIAQEDHGSNRAWIPRSWVDVVPSKLRLTPQGEKLHELAGLAFVAEPDVRAVIGELAEA